MKKKQIISIAILAIIIFGVACFFLFKNKVSSIITLDINPSIKLYLDKENRVLDIEALNEDAKEIITKVLKGVSLEESLSIITENLYDNGYIEPGDVSIIMYSAGTIDEVKLEAKIKEAFSERDVTVDLIIVENVSKLDERTATKYNVSPAKAAYINSIIEDEEKFNIEIIIDKPVNEIKEFKERGMYCNDGYFLEGDWCYKEISRENAPMDKICPIGYYEYKNTCYEETGIIETDNLYCRDEYKLNNTECVRTMTLDATVTSWTCQEGEVRTKEEAGLSVKGAGDAKEPVCIDPTSITRPVSPCDLPSGDSTERLSYGGKCYWHRAPIIPEGCPGKIKVNGECWDDASNVYVCPNSGTQREKGDYCYKVLKNVKATPNGYTCEEGFILSGNKCIKEEKEEALHERVCPASFTLVDNDRCINTSATISKEDGYVCTSENARVKGNVCIVYDMVEAIHNIYD